MELLAKLRFNSIKVQLKVDVPKDVALVVPFQFH